MKLVSVPHFSSTLFDPFLFFSLLVGIFCRGNAGLYHARDLVEGYRNECGWRSLGAIVPECLIGYPPFCSETTHEMSQKVTNLPHYLIIPDDVHLNRKVVDLIWKYVKNPFSPTAPAPDLAPRRLRHPRASGSAKCAVPHRITHTWFRPASFRGNRWLRSFNVLRNRDSVISNSSR